MGYLKRAVERFYEEVAYRSLKVLASSPDPEIVDGLGSIGLSFRARIEGPHIYFESHTPPNKQNTKARQFRDFIAMDLLGRIPANEGAKRGIERANRELGAISVNTRLSDLVNLSP